ncbi:MAG: hypothetical protein ABIZ04_26165 [Opitutus sp.]
MISPPLQLRFLVGFALAVQGATLFANDSVGSDSESERTRTQLSAQIERNIQAGTIAMASASEQSKLLEDSARAEFEAIADVVRSAERRLRRSLRTLSTTSAANWQRSRFALEVDYEAYAEAINQAERLIATELANAEFAESR